MKYLTPYKLFESDNYDDINIIEISQTIKDILLPISDKGYEIVVTDDVDLNGEFIGTIIIKIVDYKDNPLKVTDEVKEDFIRMNDYLESEGFNSIKAIYVGYDTRTQKWLTLDPTQVDKRSSGRVDFSKFISIDSGGFMSLVFVAEFN